MLANKIRARAALLGLSLPRLAELAGVPLRTLQENLAAGRFGPDTIAKLGSALSVDSGWFERGPEDASIGADLLLEGARL